MTSKLNRREQTVINYKANGGNMKQAMIDAGYSETYADKNSRYLLGIIGQQIKDEQDTIKSTKIKSVEEIQEWWAKVMDNEEADLKNRIRCSENLAKSQGAFVDKVEFSGKLNNPFAGMSTDELKELIAGEE